MGLSGSFCVEEKYMKVVKNINNNVSLCIDSQGNEVVAFGKGIGFVKPPYEIDLAKVERTFYNITSDQMALFKGISPDYFHIAMKIVDYATTQLKSSLNPNLVFILADHISFSIERKKKGLKVKMPDASYIETQYPHEMHIAKIAIQYIQRKTKVVLGDEEVVSIALHLLNAETITEEQEELSLDRETLYEDIFEIIEDDYDMLVDRSSFSAKRFMTHLEYLFNRIEDHNLITSENRKIFETLKDQYPGAYKCAEKIAVYLKDKTNINLNDEEQIYLMLHINRLTTREKL